MKVKLVKSLIQRKSDQVATAHALGLKRIGDSVELKGTPSELGMVKKIQFLLEVSETSGGEGASK